MLKSMAILASGIFIGAAGMEIVRKKYPESMNKLYAAMNRGKANAKQAFMEGYHGALTRNKPAGIAVLRQGFVTQSGDAAASRQAAFQA